MKDRMKPTSLIGASIPRVDGEIKATGQAIYATDLKRPSMLFGKILYSDRPHARIEKIDFEKALAVDGVVCAVSAEDTPDVKLGIYIQDRRIFAHQVVRHIGEPVAAIAATSRQAAEEAVRRIEVAYQDLPAIFDPFEAMQPEAPIIHPNQEAYAGIYPYRKHGNVCMEAELDQGDAQAAMEAAERIIEDEIELRPVHQASIEPHACLSEFGTDGKLTIYTATQQLSVCLFEVATSLGIPMNRLRIIPVWLGGGFGGKLKSHLEPICGLLSLKSRKPVKMELTREEEFVTTHPRAPYWIRIRSGVNAEGKILAREVEIVVDAGAYTDHTIGETTHALTIAPGAYQVPHCHARARVVYTNNPDWGCMRGYGATEMNFAVERHMNHIARELGRDPAQIRYANLCQEGQVYLNSQVLKGVNIQDTMDQALEVSGYLTRKGKLGPNRGIGISNAIHGIGLLSSSVFVKINEDCTVSILTSITDLGTGNYTALCQIAAEVLEVPISRVSIAQPDTDSSPYDTGSIDSRTIFDTGGAVKLAAEDARRQLIQVAADTFGCKTEDVEYHGGSAYLSSNPAAVLPLQALIGIALYVRQGPVTGKGSQISASPFPQPVGKGYAQGPVGAFVFATHVAEVEVDPETGKVRVLNYTASHDVGRIINRSGLEGQVTGGVIQGIGTCLMEELQLENGRIVNPSLVDYRLPTALDIPAVQMCFIEKPDLAGPFGAKGVGEMPAILPLAAIANAIEDATGVSCNVIPITPERLFHNLQGKTP